MSVFKCKMCGGDVELSQDKTFGTCESCGSSMTFPKVNDEQRIAMFNRGNAFRRAGEFDKALALYENIIREDDTDAEAHWCCALCRFGIEYVEDPTTLEFVPTCHRASFDSFLEDIDYRAAIENADGINKRQYQKDALKITDVQKGILATSQNEAPFDVFICYKETDDTTGQRTRDSIDAQEIYYQLTNEGYRVFFSRITLEDIIGTEYEPYIFAALNSAKVMVVIGSKVEYFNAVWVKNEWSRFLAMMRKDRSKLILPCYRDIDPYELPEQISVLQSYDMSRIGFIQDLIRGIKKVVSYKSQPDAPGEVTVSEASAGVVNIAPLLKRAFIFIEDGKWDEADEYCEKVLDQDPECAEAYLGKLLAELKVNSIDDLKNSDYLFDDKYNYIKACKYDKSLSDKLSKYSKIIKDRQVEQEKSKKYTYLCKLLLQCSKESDYLNLGNEFYALGDYEDSKEKADYCFEKNEELKTINLSSAELVSVIKEKIKEYEKLTINEKIEELLGELNQKIKEKDEHLKSLTPNNQKENYELEEEILHLQDEYIDLFDRYEGANKYLYEKIENLSCLIEKLTKNSDEDVLNRAKDEFNKIVSSVEIKNEDPFLKEFMSSEEIYICPICHQETRVKDIHEGNIVFCENCDNYFELIKSDNEGYMDIAIEEKDYSNRNKLITTSISIALIIAILITMLVVTIDLFK